MLTHQQSRQLQAQLNSRVRGARSLPQPLPGNKSQFRLQVQLLVRLQQQLPNATAGFPARPRNREPLALLSFRLIEQVWDYLVAMMQRQRQSKRLLYMNDAF